MWVSTDGGANFIARTLAVSGYSGIMVMRGTIVVAGSTGILYRSWDYGVTWAPFVIGSMPAGTTYNWTVQASPGGEICYALGSPSTTLKLMYRSGSTRRLLNYIAPPSTGLKWVIKAR